VISTGQSTTLANISGPLVEAAWAASHAKHTYLATHYRRLAARRGAKRALVAVAHTILIIAYYIIHDGTTYQYLGSNYFDDRDRQATLRRSVKRLERLGYKVTVEALTTRTTESLRGPARIRRFFTASPATATRCTPTPYTRPAPASCSRFCTVCARTA